MLYKNLGVLAHVDAGKTTLTEQLLWRGGAVRQAGRVDDGTARTDSLAVERERGISVRAASATFEYGGCTLNVIDTPGHVDFAGEVERCLGALDFAVVVVSAVEGVQSHTENILRALDEYEMPRLIFINKLDRAGADPDGVLADLRERFAGRDYLLMSAYSSAGDRSCAVSALSDDAMDSMLTEALAERYDDIADAFLSDRQVPRERLAEALRADISRCAAVPVLYGSALLGIGTAELLDAICMYMPDSSRRAVDGLSALVYKIEHDSVMGKIAHVRMFGGELRARDAVLTYAPTDNACAASDDGTARYEDGERASSVQSSKVQTTEQAKRNAAVAAKGADSTVNRLSGDDGDGREPEKISQIRRFTGTKYTDVGVLRAGEIGALCGLYGAKCGHWIGEAAPDRHAELAHPYLSVKAAPADPSKLTETVAALRELADEEPLLDCRWERTEREIVLSVTGDVQVEIIGRLLKERYGLDAVFSPPSVIYRETPTRAGYGFEAYTMPKPCWAVVKLYIEPLPRGSGVVWDGGNVKHTKLFYKYQTHIRQSFFDAIKQGPMGWELTDMRVTLADGEHHTIHTHPLDFFVATPMALADGLRNTGTTLLEPMLRVRLTAPAEYRGKIITELSRAGAEIDPPVPHGPTFSLEATVPVATTLDFPVRLASLSGGRAVWSPTFAGYRECPADRLVTTPRRGVDPLDRAKWILYARGAMQDKTV